MAHNVKCFFCGKTFDRDKEPCKKVTERRYAHLKCLPSEQTSEILKEEESKQEFWECIKKIYGPKYNYLLINKQAETFMKQYGYTWKSMTRSLQWFYFINNGSKENGYGGIGIIPYIYDKAKDYYYKIYLAQKKNEKIRCGSQTYNIQIQSPRAWHQLPRLLDF